MHTYNVRLVGITGSKDSFRYIGLPPTDATWDLHSYAHVVRAFAYSRLVSRVRLNIPQQEPLCDLTGVSVTRGFFDKRLGLWLSLPHASIFTLHAWSYPIWLPRVLVAWLTNSER